MSDILDRAKGKMPSSLNDACRTIEMMADEIADLKKAHQILLALIGNRDKDVDDLRAQLTHATNEILVIRDVLMNPHPDQEPDNLRLHREKCDALAPSLRARGRRWRWFAMRAMIPTRLRALGYVP